MTDLQKLLHLNCFCRVRNNSIEIFLNSLPHNIILYEGYIFSLYRSLFPALLSNNWAPRSLPRNSPAGMCCLWHLTRSRDHKLDRWVYDTYPHRYTFTWLLNDEQKSEKKRVKERGRKEEREREEGGVKCWNMNYKPEQHHLDRENTHHSGEPAH